MHEEQGNISEKEKEKENNQNKWNKMDRRMNGLNLEKKTRKKPN